MNRRDFLKLSIGNGPEEAHKPIVPSPEELNDFISQSHESDYISSKVKLNADVVQAMVDESIKQLTGISTLGGAWKSLMPDIKTDSIIAIKVNCRSSALPTHPELTYAVANGLTQMQIEGHNFPENNIHIYDDHKAYFEFSGYTVNTSSKGIRCYSEKEFSDQSYNINGVPQKVVSLVHDKADYLINIGVLKNHASMAGVTLCMTNHFGSIDSPHKLHLNCGDPYIGIVNSLEPIKSKQVLAILDGILGAAEGGPYGNPTFVANKIFMSQDTVAVDYLGRELLIEQNSSTADWATYIDSAADYGIGTNDPTKMEIVNIKNPSTENKTFSTAASSGETLCRVVIAGDTGATNV